MINIDDRILSEVDENQLFLLCAIAKHMGANAKAWPSNKTLCETTRWSANKLQRVKKSAIEAGILGAESRFVSNAQSSNIYQIKTRRVGVMVNLADITPHPQNGDAPHPQNGDAPHPQNVDAPHPQNGDAEVLTNEVLTNEQEKAGKPPKPKKPKSEKKENQDGGEVSEVIKFLNDTVRPAYNFRENSKTTAGHIKQRIAEGFTVSDICIVIEHKTMQWRNDAKMSEYLRPATLFGTGKFESYLVSARTWEQNGKKDISRQTQNRSTTTSYGSDISKFEQPQIF